MRTWRCRSRAALGSRIAGFAVNGDAGATASPGQVSQALRKAPTGSIVIMPMNHPGHGTRPGLADALPRLLSAGTRFVHLTCTPGSRRLVHKRRPS